jgi:outer membrane protein assembly factor BamD
MANKEDVEAEAAFDDFLKLYPSDPKVADALFLKGTLLSRQVLPPGRDQQKTRDAIQAFTQFAEKAPGSPLAAQVSEKIRSLRDRLALHEAAVVKNFLSRKLYDSAEARARRAVAAYPDVPAARALQSLLAESLERQGKKDEALAVRKAVPEPIAGQGGKKR